MFLIAKQCLSISEKILPLLLVNNRIRTPFMSWIGEVVTVLGIALITIAWNLNDCFTLFFYLSKKLRLLYSLYSRKSVPQSNSCFSVQI